MTARINNEIYYFLKLLLQTADCQEVYELEHMPNGKDYLWLWIRLGIMAANRGGVLAKTVANTRMPLTVRDLANEMRGAYKEAEIREGLMLLEKLRFIERYTDPESCCEFISVSTLTGDHGTFHLIGSDKTFRPMIVGTDSAYAEYQRNRRAELKTTAGTPLIGMKRKDKTVKDIMRATGCSKQTVFNRIMKEQLQDFTVREGKQLMIRPDAAAYLAAVIKGKKPDPAFLEALKNRRLDDELDDPLDGVDDLLDDGLDDNRLKLDGTSSSEDAEKCINKGILTICSLAVSNETHALNKINRVIDVYEEDKTYNQTLTELFALASSEIPSNEELRSLEQMVKQYGHDEVRYAAKRAGARNPDNPLGYIYSILKQSESSRVPPDHIDENRSVDLLLSLAAEELGCRVEDIPQWFIDSAVVEKKYYTDKELIFGLRDMSIRADFSKNSFAQGLRKVSGR